MKAKITRTSKNFLGLFVCVLFGLVLFFLSGQNGVGCKDQYIDVDDNQFKVSDSVNLGYACHAGDEFRLTFPEWTTATGQKAFWKMDKNSWCNFATPEMSNATETGNSRTVYTCTYPSNGNMTITMRKAAIRGTETMLLNNVNDSSKEFTI